VYSDKYLINIQLQVIMDKCDKTFLVENTVECQGLSLKKEF